MAKFIAVVKSDGKATRINVDQIRSFEAHPRNEGLTMVRFMDGSEVSIEGPPAALQDLISK